MLWNEQQKIYNTKIIKSAKLIEQLITIFLKEIVHPKNENLILICLLQGHPSRAALTIGLGGAETPGPKQGGGPWLAVE